MKPSKLCLETPSPAVPGLASLTEVSLPGTPRPPSSPEVVAAAAPGMSAAWQNCDFCCCFFVSVCVYLLPASKHPSKQHLFKPPRFPRAGGAPRASGSRCGSPHLARSSELGPAARERCSSLLGLQRCQRSRGVTAPRPPVLSSQAASGRRLGLQWNKVCSRL